MAVTPRRFTVVVGQARKDTDRFLARLQLEYRAALRAAGRRAADAFTAHATAILAAAGDPPRFIEPDMDEVLDAERMAEDMQARTKRPREQAGRAMVNGIAGRLGIKMDVAHVMADSLILSAGARTADATAATRTAIQLAIRTGIEQGLSVPNTAALIREAINEIAPAQALMLARTDLNSVQNGGSITAARAVYPDGNLAKQWLATNDDRTRESHSDADGQQVALEQPFQVGDDSLDYPGDPAGSDEEVCNCRCTLIYAEAKTPAEVAAGGAPTILRVTEEELEQVRVVPVNEPSLAELTATIGQLAVALAAREQLAPNVHVYVPEGPVPQVTVEAAQVNVQPTPVTVENRVELAEGPAPQVTVNVPPAEVSVTVEPAPVVIEDRPVPPVEVTIRRDAGGNMIGATIEEEE